MTSWKGRTPGGEGQTATVNCSQICRPLSWHSPEEGFQGVPLAVPSVTGGIAFRDKGGWLLDRGGEWEGAETPGASCSIGLETQAILRNICNEGI